MENGNKDKANKYLIGGIFFFVIGGGLLLWTSGYTSFFAGLIPALLLFLGLFLAIMVFIKGIPDFYLFPSIFVILLGVFLILKKKILPSGELTKLWPLFMTAAGLSLLMLALRKKGGSRIKLLVPSVALIVLSGLFLPFSMGVAGISFLEFVKIWWPALFLLLGIFSIVFYFRNKNNSKGE